MRKLGLALIAGWMTVSPLGWAQAPAPTVIDHYRAYLNAVEAGDPAAAEAAAESAWRASEAAGAPPAETAVLAFNLASLRVEAGARAAALEPARRAVELVRAGGQGMELSLGDAAAVLGIAELAAKIDGAPDRLLIALRSTPLELGADPSWRHRAAFYLGPILVASERYREAVEAYEIAERTADPAAADVDYFRGVALTGQGAALLLSQREDDARLRLERALSLLTSFAPEQVGDGETRGFRAFVQARAWYAAATSTNPDPRAPPRAALPQRKMLTNAPPLCAMRFEPAPMPRYPRAAASRSAIGAVVLRLKTDASGKVLRATYAAKVPENGFAEAVPLERIRWRTTVSRDSAQGCRRQSDDILQVIRFQIE